MSQDLRWLLAAASHAPPGTYAFVGVMFLWLVGAAIARVAFGMPRWACAVTGLAALLAAIDVTDAVEGTDANAFAVPVAAGLFVCTAVAVRRRAGWGFHLATMALALVLAGVVGRDAPSLADYNGPAPFVVGAYLGVALVARMVERPAIVFYPLLGLTIALVVAGAGGITSSGFEPSGWLLFLSGLGAGAWLFIKSRAIRWLVAVCLVLPVLIVFPPGGLGLGILIWLTIVWFIFIGPIEMWAPRVRWMPCEGCSKPTRRCERERAHWTDDREMPSWVTEGPVSYEAGER